MSLRDAQENNRFNNRYQSGQEARLGSRRGNDRNGGRIEQQKERRARLYKLIFASPTKSNPTAMHVPDLRNQILYRIPGQTTIRNSSPPAREIWCSNIRMAMQVVCNRDLVILEGRRDEADMKRGVLRFRGRGERDTVCERFFGIASRPRCW